MQRYILKRIGLAILTVFFVVSFIFFIARVSGDPLDLMMSEDATEEEWERLHRPEDQVSVMKVKGARLKAEGVNSNHFNPMP